MRQRSGLSKSRIALFEQCAKRLWLSVHRPELTEESVGIRQAFADGHRVGDLACQLLPTGVMIGADAGLAAALEQTQALLRSGWDRPIFEATFAHGDVLVRVDILEPATGGWHMAEVKNTTGVKAYHIGDVATQLWVLRENGVPVASAAIRHLDREFTLVREDDYVGLFTDTPVGHLAEPVAAARPQRVNEAQVVLAGKEPKIAPGAYCTVPFPCSFRAYCSRDLPIAPEWPVTLLPGAAGKKVASRLLEAGIDNLPDAPAAAMTSPKLAHIHHATISGEVWHDAAAVRAATKGWAYPRIYLDFETIQMPIPPWLGTRPFEQVPFQFSAHIEAADETLSHAEFLSTDGSDPRRGCAEALAALPSEGAVVAWNMAFERGCWTALAAQFPDLAPKLTSLAARLVDLLPIARRYYYHRDMRGSWSIKAVLPTLARTGYEELGEVRTGTDAQAGYLEAIASETSKERTASLRHALLEYCRRDTKAMVEVLKALMR